MTVCLMLISDGRDDYRASTIESFRKSLPAVNAMIEVQDPDHTKGFCGAIQEGWERVRESGCDFVFHLEADFTFNAPVDLGGMLHVLDTHPEIAQLALKRQPWNGDEQAAGGIVELHPEDFEEKTDGRFYWTEHRRFWTTNPSVYSTRWCKLGWPQESQSEGKFTHKLLADPLLRFAYWGRKFAPPLVEHIGHVRAGASY